MEQQEFFEVIKNKMLKEVVVTFPCDCQTIYSPMTKEIFANLCPKHDKLV